MMIGNINTKRLNILGLMTGSSADGLDLCLVQFSGQDRSPEYDVLYSREIPYPEHFQTSFRNPLMLTNEKISALDVELGKWFADEIKALNLHFDVIASHGQTIKHEPPNFTLQIGHPRLMSESFGCPVIHDFRTADIKMGGQGAPLIPIVDQFLFQQENTDILALNIGGIANLTMIPGIHNPAPLLAWDTGPGNTLIDKAVRLFSQGKLTYDVDGHLAAQGKVNLKLLKTLLDHEFYQRPPPRSAGQEQFGITYFQHILEQFYPANEKEFKDFIHTVTLLTARTIADSVAVLSSGYSANSMHVAGGGALNTTLMGMLREELPALDINQINLPGINQGNKEAFGFAYLGYLFIHGFTGNIPSVTGARKPVMLGKLFQA